MYLIPVYTNSAWVNDIARSLFLEFGDPLRLRVPHENRFLVRYSHPIFFFLLLVFVPFIVFALVFLSPSPTTCILS